VFVKVGHRRGGELKAESEENKSVCWKEKKKRGEVHVGKTLHIGLWWMFSALSDCLSRNKAGHLFSALSNCLSCNKTGPLF
jgi:hypothetical protein